MREEGGGLRVEGASFTIEASPLGLLLTRSLTLPLNPQRPTTFNPHREAFGFEEEGEGLKALADSGGSRVRVDGGRLLQVLELKVQVDGLS